MERERRIRAILDRRGFSGVELRESGGSIVLEGRVKSWEDKIEAGYIASEKGVGGDGYRGVVNDISAEGVTEPALPLPGYADGLLEGRSFDVVIVGGGVIGCAVARELTRSNLTVALLEKEDDIAMHASSRNDGMIHPGFAPSPDTLKARYNIRGNRAYDRVCRELDVPMKRTGSMILFPNRRMRFLVPFFHYRCRRNGVEGARYMSPDEVRAREPYVTDGQHGAFFFPSAGQLSPYQLTFAYAENAVSNGAEIFLRTGVRGFEMEQGREGKPRVARIETNRGTLKAGVVVNAAGAWADIVAGLAEDRFFSIHGRKGVDALLDITTGEYQKTVMALIRFSHLTSKTKGGGVVPTVEGNLLVGPTAVETPDREDYSTTEEDIEDLITRFEVNKMIDKSDIITYFAGVRACTYEEDFIIEPSRRVENLIHAAGIQSPGIASAPAVAEDVAGMCRDAASRLCKDVKPNPRFDPVRKGTVRLKQLRDEERSAFIRKNPSYGRIVCRCEEISEGEIRDALHSSVPVVTLDGIKRRTRSGMGRCQGGFCTPRVMEIFREETGLELDEITKKGPGSEILYGPTKKPAAEPEADV